jgi:hypothetical protein
MTTRCVLTAVVFGLMASSAWGGTGPISDGEVKVMIEAYRQRMAASEASVPDVSDNAPGRFAEVPWLDTFEGVECPKFSVVDPAVISQQGTWLAMGMVLEGDEKQPVAGTDGAPAKAQSPGGQAEELAKKLQNPVASLISVPIKIDYDEGLGPSGDGSLWTLNIQPVIPFALNKDWNIISRTIVPIIHQGDLPTKGHSETGLGDILQSFFLSPSELTDRGWVWGVGPVINLPTASDDALGTGKWGLGPTAVALKQEGPWTVGALANHVWSVAGDSDRADVSVTYFEPWVSYTTKENTTISVSVETVYDWETEETSAPVNLILEQLFQVGEQYISVGGSVHYWVASSPGGPEGFGFGLQVTFLFPN